MNALLKRWVDDGEMVGRRRGYGGEMEYERRMLVEGFGLKRLGLRR